MGVAILNPPQPTTDFQLIPDTQFWETPSERLIAHPVVWLSDTCYVTERRERPTLSPDHRNNYFITYSNNGVVLRVKWYPTYAEKVFRYRPGRYRKVLRHLDKIVARVQAYTEAHRQEIMDALITTSVTDPCVVIPFSSYILARISVVRMLF